MHKPQPQPVTVLHVLAAALFAVAFIILGALSLQQTVSLWQSESVAIARVVESRTMRKRRGGTSFEVRYLFSPTPGAPEIARSDFLGRTNLWSPLPEPDWQVATDTMRLPVRFDPRHPGNSVPNVSVPTTLADSAALLGLGLVCGGAVVYAERARRRQSTPGD